MSEMEANTPVVRLLTQRDRIRHVAERWEKQYRYIMHEEGGRFNKIYKRLLALDGETATAQDVEVIIGNSMWTEYFCRGCARHYVQVVEIKLSDEWDEDITRLCPTCLEAMYKALKSPLLTGDTNGGNDKEVR